MGINPTSCCMPLNNAHIAIYTDALFIGFQLHLTTTDSFIDIRGKIVYELPMEKGNGNSIVDLPHHDELVLCDEL